MMQMMRKLLRHPSFLLLLCHVLSKKLARSESKLAATSEHCSLYIAPSTIPNAGLGIFTARLLEYGDRIGDDDIMIPIVDADLYMGSKFTWMIDDYTWDGAPSGLGRESERQNGVSGYGPGLDGAINCNIALLNVDRELPQWYDAGLHRLRNPGAGAIAQYSGGITFAKAQIPAGGELFKYYGDEWFRSRSAFANMPLYEDYTRANQLLLRFLALNSPHNVKASLYDLIATAPFQSRTLNALPAYDNITQAVMYGIGSLQQPGAVRSLQDLASTGRCLDNIRTAPSTLPEAGRGAFATRPLPAGSVVTGSPLFHIPYDEMLFMYKTEWNESNLAYDVDTSKVKSYQLLLNYCWGHSESTVLLCPYGAGVNFINHNQSLANVAIRWAPDGELSHNATWLQQTSVADMANEYSTKLAIDFVALRDIQPGEEIFLDYGDEWEEAWIRHVKTWEQYSGHLGALHTRYQPASLYNLDGGLLIRTKQEQESDPYPANLELRCHEQTMYFLQDPSGSWINPSFGWQPAEEGYECEVLERVPRGVDHVYTVRLKHTDGQFHVARNVTRAFVAFFDRPYSTDMHLPWAFRHKLIIPDAMFPDSWKTSKEKRS
jgi:hypothetical protein